MKPKLISSKQDQVYAVRFKTEDGEHLGGLHLTKRDHVRAQAAAARLYTRVDILEIKPVTDAEFDEMAKDLVAKYPTRVPLDEKTGGKTIRVLNDPSLAGNDDD